MKRKSIITLVLFSLLMTVLLPTVSSTAEGGLLPSLTETVGIAMPSLGEALGRYPDKEIENGDGSITELYTNVSESDFNTFSVYLEQQEAKLADYKVDKGVLSAEVLAKGVSFSLNYDSKNGEARVTYPSGAYDGWTKSAQSHITESERLLSEGQRYEAYLEILSIPQYDNYKPAIKMLQNKWMVLAAKQHEDKLKSFRTKGSIVQFGHYEQDNIIANGKEEIEWIVLDVKDGKVLLLSKYLLDQKKFINNELDYSGQKANRYTWENSSLREWLNNDFFNEAFNEKERMAIVVTELDNGPSTHRAHYWDNGPNTLDKVFLLNSAETDKYVGTVDDSEARMEPRAAPTEYAKQQGDASLYDKYVTIENKKSGNWWLRSSGNSMNEKRTETTSYGREGVQHHGVIHSFFVDWYCFVRPAIWLDLESGIF